MAKLPLPPVPKLLNPRPRRPGEVQEVKPVDQVKEAGISAAGGS